MKTTNKWLTLIIILVLVASIVMIFTLNASAASTVTYLDDKGEMQVRSNVTELTGSLGSQTLNAGWYVFSGTVSASTLTLNGDVHLILGDGASVSAYKIFVPYGSNLTIYAQMEKTGTLKVDPGTKGIAIGGNIDNAEAGMGNITINGGIINATGEHQGCAIGVGENVPSDKIGNIVINDGTITAINSTYYNAIGFDSEAPNSTITINGGTITAKTGNYTDSNRSYAVGIGGDFTFGGIFINGGNLNVYGEALAIGGLNTPITITGGRITASVRLGSVIGSQTQIGPITISGGYINASTNSEHPAIGTGLSQSPASPITISGGTIIAKGGQYAIGGSNYYGGDKAFNLILTGGNLILTGSKGTIHKNATIKNANGDTITTELRTLTLTNAPNGTEILSIGDIAYGINGVETNDSKLYFYFPTGTSIPTAIRTNNGIYLPDSEGSTTYSLHSSHTVAPVYSAYENDHEKHNAFYSCCNENVVEAHIYDEHTLICPCEAFVIADVNGEQFANFDNAIRSAQALESAVITLHADASLSDDINVSGNITLDLNGNALLTSDKYMYAIYLRTGSLILKDSSTDKSGSIVANSLGVDTIGVENGALTVESGTYGKLTVENGTTITIHTSTIRELSVRAGTVLIQGGEFGLLTAPVALQTTLANNLFFYDSEGTIVDASTLTTVENVTTKAGADLTYAEATLEYTQTDYTALEKRPALTLYIFGTEIFAENFEISYEDNILPGTAKVIVKGIGDYIGEKTFTFEINKGKLVVLETPNTTHPFGDTYSDKAITDGKVVIVGNEEAVIGGIWTYVENEPRATFVPDAEYDGLFDALTEAYDVNITVTAYEPVFTISAPVTVLIPGVETLITVDVKNFFDSELTDLPTEFIIYYRIGEDLAEVRSTGLSFTLIPDVKMGDTITLRVENVAVDGKYTVANSTNTLVFTVGQADYSSEFEQTKDSIDNLKDELSDITKLQEDINATLLELSNALSEKASDEAVSGELNALQEKINLLNALVDDLKEGQNNAGDTSSQTEKNNGTAVAAIVISAIAIVANLGLAGYILLIKPKRG